MNKFEQMAYGMSTEDIQEQYMESITARFSGLEMVVMGILSDCQELGVSNDVRKQLNIAKYILAEMLHAQREAA